MNHGTEYAYVKLRCRCDLCRTAANEARRRRRYVPHVKKHGAVGYSSGCRCAICTAGNREYRRYGYPPAAELHPEQLAMPWSPDRGLN